MTTKKTQKTDALKDVVQSLLDEVKVLHEAVAQVKNERLAILRHYLVMCDCARKISALGRPRWWDAPATRRHRAELLARYNREHDFSEELARRQTGEAVTSYVTNWNYTGSTSMPASIQVTYE